MLASICLMVTGSLLIPSTHEASQGAGHSLPVNSGKLLVACSRSIAAFHWPAINQVVPVGDQVAERAAQMTERNTAVHAARALRLQLLDRERLVDFQVVVDAARRSAAAAAAPGDIRESRSAYPRVTSSIIGRSVTDWPWPFVRKWPG